MLGGIAALWLGARAQVRPSGTAVGRVTVPLAGLPTALDGLAIQVVADLHVRSHRSPGLRALDELAGLQPDFLFACGDLVDDADATPLVARALAAIEPRHGAYAVWGNHDLMAPPKVTDPGWIGVRAQPLNFMREAFQAHGITLLDNARVEHQINGEVLAIAGVGDATERRDDAKQALCGADDDVFTLVLTHNPDATPRLGASRVDLVVCGHTHGGQIVPVFMPPVTTSTRLLLRRPAGLVHVDGRLVFITRGIGTVGIPLRINAPAEAPVLTLVRVGG